MIPESQIKALTKLLDDDDQEVISHVQEKIMSFGTSIIPMLEQEWESTFNPIIQEKIEDLIHELQFDLLSERFIDWKESGAENLLEGLWIIGTYQYPDLELNGLIKQVEQLYHEMWRQMKEDMNPRDQVNVFNDIFFNQFHFRPNTKNFYSPANSMINSVLETRKGTPISLCSIYMLLAQKMGLPIYGVNLPNLFILTYLLSDNKAFYINVFNRGLIFTKLDIDNYLDNLNLQKQNLFYSPCSNLDIVLRVLRNLIVSFEKLADYHKADEIKVILQKLDNQYFNL